MKKCSESVGENPLTNFSTGTNLEFNGLIVRKCNVCEMLTIQKLMANKKISGTNYLPKEDSTHCHPIQSVRTRQPSS